MRRGASDRVLRHDDSAVPEGPRLWFRFNLDLAADLRALLADLLGRLRYLGRRESRARLRIADSAEPPPRVPPVVPRNGVLSAADAGYTQALCAAPGSRAAAAFDAGEISWSALREITRIAEADTEAQWIEFARKRSFAHLRAEVQEAAREGRKVPRSDRCGLAGLKTRLVTDLEPHEHVIVEKALRKATGELSQRLGGQPVEAKKALLFICERILETDPAGTPAGRVEREDPTDMVVHRHCPDCRGSHATTSEAPAEEVVDRVAPSAERIEIRPEEEIPPEKAKVQPEIDRPNPPYIVRKVLARDGQRCGNPFCRRRLGLHAHHIIFRHLGGRTALWNEITVCALCHSRLHLGLLEIVGNVIDDLRWVTAADKLDLRLKTEGEEVASVPVVLMNGRTGPSAQAAPSARADAEAQKPKGDGKGDDTGDSIVWERIFDALRGLGFSARGARERIERAKAKLRGLGRKPEDREALGAALSA